jgi:hypothetical protein
MIAGLMQQGYTAALPGVAEGSLSLNTSLNEYHMSLPNRKPLSCPVAKCAMPDRVITHVSESADQQQNPLTP